MGPVMQGQVGMYLVADIRLFREALAGILRKKPDLCVLGAGPSTEGIVQEVMELNPQIWLIDSDRPRGTRVRVPASDPGESRHSEGPDDWRR